MKDLSRKVTFFLKKDNYENSREIWGQYLINTDQSTQVQINTDVILRNIMLYRASLYIRIINPLLLYYMCLAFLGVF